MLIRDKKTFHFGMLMGLSFMGVLLVIFSPVFGGKNGLEYSDALFNKLAKGSSYFITKLSEEVKPLEGKEIGASIKIENADQAARAAKILDTAGGRVESQGSTLQIAGDLGKVLNAALRDSDAMYYNRGDEVGSRYAMDAREVMSVWWSVLNKTAKELQKTKRLEEASVIFNVVRKGIEPAYNFYGVDAQKVSEKALTVLGLLGFYVVYTMWWGYGIFYLFDGIGLSMKKARVKKEV